MPPPPVRSAALPPAPPPRRVLLPDRPPVIRTGEPTRDLRAVSTAARRAVPGAGHVPSRRPEPVTRAQMVRGWCALALLVLVVLLLTAVLTGHLG